MTPGTHLLISWSCANVVDLSRRDRILVTLAGLAPDLDGVGYVTDYLGLTSDLYCRIHHIGGHNLGACLIYLVITAGFAQRRFLGFTLAAATFHIHLLCDIISGRGPDGYQWPIPYLMPFSDSLNWTWSGQWYLHGWQNTVVYLVFVAVTVFIAIKKRVTPIDLLSERWDGAVLRSFVSMSSKRK